MENDLDWCALRPHLTYVLPRHLSEGLYKIMKNVSQDHNYRYIQSNTTINICIAKRCFYISLNNDMFRPLYRPSSGCTFSYFQSKLYNTECFCQQISCTSIKFAFKIITVAVELKSYSEIKDINSIKSCVCDLRWGGGGLWCQTGYIPVWQHWVSVVSQWIGCLVVPWWLVLGRCYVQVYLQMLWKSLLAAGGWNTSTSLCSWKVQVWMLLLHIKYILRLCGNTEWRFTLVVLFCFFVC
jgi:hypothetical protein